MDKLKDRFSYNKISLKFKDNQVEKDFRESTIESLDSFFKIGALLALGLYLAFIIFDFFEEDVNFKILIINRVVVISITILFLLLLTTPFVRKYYYFSMSFMFLTMGIGVIHATYVSNAYISSIYLVVIFFNLVPYLTAFITITINLFLIILFYFALTYVSSCRSVSAIQEIALLISGVLITFLASYVKRSTERNNYIKTKKIEKANTQINSQFDELEITHKSITDSINYAKRIQDALLPGEEDITNLPIDIELYYKPKNTIGGDFYWVDEIGDNIIIAIGDCTGHGVPGAIMTSLGINGLINSVTDQRMTKPSDILTYLDDYIYGLLSDSDDGYVKDGMDIGIVCINKKLNTISFSNAGRPLIYVDDNTLHEVKSFRRGIGSKLITTPYSTEVLPISKTATYYMFSDGMTDQFGGVTNKRLKSRVFNQLLLDWNELPLMDQKNKLIEFYTNFMKNTKQTDDMIWGAIQIK